jgi:hypothetical protein
MKSVLSQNEVRTFFFIVSFVLACNCCKAQSVNLSDSLSHVFKQKATPTAAWNTWRSFVTGKSVKIQDVRLGVAFGRNFSLGIGYHWLPKGFVTSGKQSDNIYTGELRFRYIAPYVEYSYFRKGRWEASVDLQLGIGKSWLETANQLRVGEKNMLLYEASMGVEYKILKTVAVGGGYGYRIPLVGNKALGQNFTSPVYIFGVRIIFDELYQRMKEHNMIPEGWDL